MFDIGFTEILVIATISLLVIGPERLPETVRTVSMWIGRFKRSLRDTRREIEQQIGADDIRRDLHNEEMMQTLQKIRGDVSQTLEEEIAVEDELYPPGHLDHDPNNTIDEDDESQHRLNKADGEAAAPQGETAQAASEKPAKQSSTKRADDKPKPAQDNAPPEPGNQ